MCKIPRKRERLCVGAPCRTKDEMDQLPVVVVVSLKITASLAKAFVFRASTCTR